MTDNRRSLTIARGKIICPRRKVVFPAEIIASGRRIYGSILKIEPWKTQSIIIEQIVYGSIYKIEP